MSIGVLFCRAAALVLMLVVLFAAAGQRCSAAESAEAAIALPPGAAPTSPVDPASSAAMPGRAVSSIDAALTPPGAALGIPTPPQTPAQIAAAHDLRVMTFNLRVQTIFDGLNMWSVRKPLVAQRIREFNPDLLGTQEGLSGMEDYLRTQLRDYTFMGSGRNDGKRGGEMCGVFFKTAKFEVINSGCFWLSKTPDKVGSRGWGAIFPRMVTWVKLRPRDGSPAFCWFNTHFDAWSGKARAESAKLLRTQMNSMAPAMPCIVTGDFNADQGTDPYKLMLARLAGAIYDDTTLFDAFRLAHPTPTREEGTMHSFSGKRTGQRIDWVLATPQFQVISALIDRTRGGLGYPSDHFPVTVTLRPTVVTRPIVTNTQ
jgi:endonuclease/exonuclease/phosphatase family metal-dependent hydrolase